jgi:hypothetical protein
MTQENGKIVRTSVAVVIALCLVVVAIIGVPWDEGAAERRADLLNESAIDASPASKSCGDFPIPGRVRYPPLKIEVVQGNVPCRVALGVMRRVYIAVDGVLTAPSHTGFWSCGWPETPYIRECEKTRGGQATIRARFYCRDWGASRPPCLNNFGPP